jgi:hypothetical protein
MRSDQPSRGDRLKSAIMAMGAWSLALIGWQMISNPRDWLSIAEFGTANSYIQIAMLTGVAVPFIGLVLALYFDPQKDRAKQ